MKGKTHDLIFSAHTINCVCHSIMLIFGVLGTYNFVSGLDCVCSNIQSTPINSNSSIDFDISGKLQTGYET